MAATGEVTCCLTFDFDGLTGFARGSRDRTRASQGEFGAAVGLGRILDLLTGSGVHATFFTTGDAAVSYPGLVERIRAEGHEVGHHGWAHDVPAELTRDAEQRSLERGIEALEKVTGERPRGYRAPGWATSDNTVRLLLGHGFDYDSSLMAGDFYPYYVREGDQWFDDEPASFGTPSNLVEIPVYWGLDDVMLEFVGGTVNTFLRSPDEIERLWKGDIDHAAAHRPGGLVTLTMHPHVTGRGPRIAMLNRIIEHVAATDGMSFGTVGAFVDLWRDEHPLATWVERNPLYANPRAGTRNLDSR